MPKDLTAAVKPWTPVADHELAALRSAGVIFAARQKLGLRVPQSATAHTQFLLSPIERGPRSLFEICSQPHDKDLASASKSRQGGSGELWRGLWPHSRPFLLGSRTSERPQARHLAHLSMTCGCHDCSGGQERCPHERTDQCVRGTPEAAQARSFHAGIAQNCSR